MPSILGLQADLRTFPCPHCGVAVVEGAERCASCRGRLDREQSRAAADRRERFLDAFSAAHSLVITARSLGFFLLLSRLMFVGLIGLVGYCALLLWVPIGTALWYGRYRGPFDDPEWPQVKRWLAESLGIWTLAASATAAWAWYLHAGA